MPPVSPLAPVAFPALPEVPGVRFATTACGIKPGVASDLLLVELAAATAVAGVLTRSRTASPPVRWCRRTLAEGRARGLVVNSGNANAFTGAVGLRSVAKTVAATARDFHCRKNEVFIASTGVIGEPLTTEKIVAALPGVHAALDGAAWEAAARAIMTTDTFPKGATRAATIDGTPVTVSGIAKGSGMIAPDMATMLCFVFTDAVVPAPVLQGMLERANARSFNSITVDGDTSTSDTLLAFATGRARHAPLARAGEGRARGFRKAFGEVLMDLAQQVVRDGEGAQKFVTIEVSGAASARAARRIGLAIGNSPLVKTAIAGADANWGRIVMAVGKAGEEADRDRLAIRIGGVLVAENGARHAAYDEAAVAPHMAGRDILIEVDVGVGRGKATVWTCDLTHGYIDINADYRS